LGGVERWYRSSFNQRYEPRCRTFTLPTPGDALHDSDPDTTKIRKAAAAMAGFSSRTARRIDKDPAFALSKEAGANVANPLRPVEARLAAGSGDARDSRRYGRDDL